MPKRNNCMKEIPESDFTKAAHALGNYMASLPITRKQYKHLAVLIARQLEVAENNGFLTGFNAARLAGDSDSDAESEGGFHAKN